MTVRTPPRLATWLLQHLGPSYRNESLAGDLHEEFQLNRTRAWYWQQVIAAVCIGRMMRLGELTRRSSPAWMRLRHILDVATKPLSSVLPLLPQFATSAILRLATEAAALLGVIAVAEALRRACSPGPISAVASILSLVAGIGLCLCVGAYLSLCISPALRRTSTHGRSAPTKRLMAIFAATALSAGTLTWASGASHRLQQCTSRADAPVVSFSSSGQGNPDGK